MKQKPYPVAYPISIVIVMTAFLSIMFFTEANLSVAASGSKKGSAAERPSAVAYAETQIKQLQSTLNITEDQKELWNNLTVVMRENAKDMDALHKERTENAEVMNSVERMKFHSQITEIQLNQMKKLIPPFEAFYNSLSDQQKNITDIIFRTGKYDKGKRK